MPSNESATPSQLRILGSKLCLTATMTASQSVWFGSNVRRRSPSATPSVGDVRNEGRLLRRCRGSRSSFPCAFRVSSRHCSGARQGRPVALHNMPRHAPVPIGLGDADRVGTSYPRGGGCTAMRLATSPRCSPSWSRPAKRRLSGARPGAPRAPSPSRLSRQPCCWRFCACSMRMSRYRRSTSGPGLRNSGDSEGRRALWILLCGGKSTNVPYESPEVFVLARQAVDGPPVQPFALPRMDEDSAVLTALRPDVDEPDSLTFP